MQIEGNQRVARMSRGPPTQDESREPLGGRIPAPFQPSQGFATRRIGENRRHPFRFGRRRRIGGMRR
jgi:hypothetical protein